MLNGWEAVQRSWGYLSQQPTPQTDRISVENELNNIQSDSRLRKRRSMAAAVLTDLAKPHLLLKNHSRQFPSVMKGVAAFSLAGPTVFRLRPPISACAIKARRAISGSGCSGFHSEKWVSIKSV